MPAMSIVSSDIEQRFYQSLTVSERTILNYKSSICSSYIKGILKEMFKVDSLFDITDLDKLWNLYSYVNLHPKNVDNHRLYSTAIMKYIRFMNNGKKYGHRIDLGRSQKRSTK